jgi:hypothetical protein
MVFVPAEADAATRPMNSLLQEDVTFDVVTRPGLLDVDMFIMMYILILLP